MPAPGPLAPPTRVLLAVTPGLEARARRILSGHHVEAVSTVRQAQQRLGEASFGLIVIEVAFDDSHMFELLAHIRSLEPYRATPVICLMGGGGALSALAVEATDRAAKAMLANAFLSLAKFPDDEAGNARVRRIADYLILIDGDMHQGVKSS